MSQSVIAGKFSTLDKMIPVSTWDRLTVYVVNVNNSPECYLSAIDFVTTSKPVPGLVFMFNTDNLMSSKEGCFWPRYRLFVDSVQDSIMTQIYNTVQADELSGFPKNIPSVMMCITRGNGKMCIGVITVNNDITDADVEVHIAACVEVIRGKINPDVEIAIYVNRALEITEESPIKSMATPDKGENFTIIRSSKEIEAKDTFDGGVLVSSPAVGCSLCNVGFTADNDMVTHINNPVHKRRELYRMYQEDRSSLLMTPHSHGLDIGVSSSDPDISCIEDGVVEILCKPEEEKVFKLILRNALATLGVEEEGEDVGLVIEEVGMLKNEESIELSDAHDLCYNDETKIRLKPGKKYKVIVKYKAGDIGQLRVPIMVAFYHEKKSVKTGDNYKLSRMAVELLIKTQVEDVVSLQPSVPFIPQPTQTPWRTRETVPGKPLMKADPLNALEEKLPVGRYPISEVRKKVIASRLEKCGSWKEEQAEYKTCKDLMKQGLTPTNYGDYWQFLLHCERWQEEKDIRYFDMRGVPITIDRNNNGLYNIDVPGLVESRPSVLKGDKLYVRESGDGVVEYEGAVLFVGEKHVSVSFSDKIKPKVLQRKLWDVRFSFSPFTYENMHRAVKLSSQLTQLLFPSSANFPPQSPDPIKIQCFDDRVAKNPEQFAAVQSIVSGTSGSAPFIVFGPPGTGKTVTLVEAIKQVWELYPDSHILASAPSNTAADLLTCRLAKHVPREDLYRLIAHSRPMESVTDSVKPFSNLSPTGYKFPSVSELSKYRIIVTTLVTAGKLVSAQFPQNHFQYVFVDEAGQATEPETCIALGGILSSSGHLVMAGDPFQLGPIVRSSLADKHGLSQSLLERLMSSAPFVDKETGSYDSRCVRKLLRNFRSHPMLLKLPGRLFYDNELQPCADKSLVNSCLDFPGLNKEAQGNTPIIVHGIVGQDCREGNSPSFFNPEEIFVVVEYIIKLVEYGTDEDAIGVITPYRRQVQKIKWRLEERGITDVTVGTTEEFQGQERKVIILSTVRSSPEYINLDYKHRLGFLRDPKRFNVSITRSQALLIVVGNPNILLQDKYWRDLLEYARELDCYKGRAYPRLEDSLGKMEEMYSNMVLEEGMEYARTEEMGMKSRN